jgi:hypothetical protein
LKNQVRGDGLAVRIDVYSRNLYRRRGEAGETCLSGNFRKWLDFAGISCYIACPDSTLQITSKYVGIVVSLE